MTYEAVAAEFTALDEQEQEVELHEARRVAEDPRSADPATLIRALQIAFSELDRRGDADDYQDGYVVGFGEGRATTYSPDERSARLNELCRAHDLILARTHDPYGAARELAERIAMIRRLRGWPVDEPPPYHDPAHADAMRHSYEG